MMTEQEQAESVWVVLSLYLGEISEMAAHRTWKGATAAVNRMEARDGGAEVTAWEDLTGEGGAYRAFTPRQTEYQILSVGVEE